MGAFTLGESVLCRKGRTGSHFLRSRLAGRRSARRHAPLLELLEDRTVLSPTVYTVTFWGDSPVDAHTSTSGDLRYCIGLANADTSNPDGSLIQFDPSVFGVPRTIAPQTGLVLSNQTEPIEISGPGASLLTVTGRGPNSNFSVFTVESNVSISGVTITNGENGDGGGVNNSGNLSLSNVTLYGNSATHYGGGVYNTWHSDADEHHLSGNSAYYGGASTTEANLQ